MAEPVRQVTPLRVSAATNKKDKEDTTTLHLETSKLSLQKESRPSVDALLSPTGSPKILSADEPTPTAATINTTKRKDSVPKKETVKGKDDKDKKEEGEEMESQDIVDDARFSTVPLSATPREPSMSASTTTQETGIAAFTPRTGSVSSTTNMEISLVTPRTSVSLTSGTAGLAIDKKKKRPSSINPSLDSQNPNADFILAKLERDLTSPIRASARASMDGKGMLQAEFETARKSSEDREVRSSKADAIDWDFWGNVMNDYETFAKEQSKRLAKAIEAGIPAALRGMVWQLMSASKDAELEQLYANLLKESSPHEKAISRDLGRTFPHHAFFNDGQGVGQESLFNVLKAYSLFDPECGYCQGLPFIVAPLLLVCPDEEAFCLLVRLMQSYELRGHFLPEMPGLQLRLFQFDRLIEDTLPVLHIHFLRQGVKSSMFCSQWFMTLFAYRFPLDMVFRIFDHVLATGLDSIFSFSVLLLQKNEQKLLSLRFDQILEFLKLSLLDCYKVEEELEDGEEEQIRVDDFIRDAANLRITTFQLDGYANEYVEMRRAQTAHLVEMDSLRNENRHLKARIKKLEEDFAQTETEHCDVINQLVRAKIEKEEYEAELVRFKLLYAELMHQHEENRSPNRLSSMSSLSGNRQVSA